MSTQQEIIEYLDSEVEAFIADWIAELINERNYDRPMAELQVIEAVELWVAEIDATELI
jgi:hypothetical protein